jgi:caa(3)-type oxidase subunit IV
MADELITPEATHDPAVQTGVHAGADAHGDVTVVMGRELPFPLYTVVFFGLGILTMIEVAISLIISSDITIPFLLAIAVAKAGLVIYYYMHLNKDSRVFAAILALPIGIALLSVLFLFAIPQGY